MTLPADPLRLAAWHEAWLAAGARSLDATLHDELIASYQEPQRAYHTLQHLREALSLLPRWAAAAPHPAPHPRARGTGAVVPRRRVRPAGDGKRRHTVAEWRSDSYPGNSAGSGRNSFI